MSIEDFQAGFEWVKLCNKDEPLLGVLKKGPSKINVLYLQHLLKKYGEPKAKSDQAAKPLPADDPAVLMLLKEKKSLFGRRARLSNSFHDATTDAERANISDDIRIVQGHIKAVMRKIEYYQKTGNIPEEAAVKEVELSGVEIMKQLNSVRSKISYHKKKLLELAAQQNKGDEISKREKKLKQLERERESLQASAARQAL